MDLVTIAVAALGLLSTLGGIFWTQRQANAREDRQAAREQERAQVEKRRASYLAFEQAVRRFWVFHVSGDLYRSGKDAEAEMISALRDLADAAAAMQVFGSPEAISAAEQTTNQLQFVHDAGTSGTRDEAKEHAFGVAEKAWLAAARKDLGVDLGGSVAKRPGAAK